MKKVLTIIMSVALTVSLVLTMAIFAIKNTVTKETLSDVITENLFAYQNENQNLYLAYSLPSGIDPSKVDEALSKYGIDHQTFEELMDDPEVQTTIEEYTTEINDFLSGNTSTLNIDESSVRAKVDSIITNYEEKTGTTIDKEQISTVISEAVTTLKENIENPKVTKILNLVSAIIFKNTVLYALIALDIILGLAIVFLSKGVLALGVSATISGLIIAVAGVVLKIVKVARLASLLSVLAKQLLIAGIIALIIGLVLIVVTLIITRKTEKGTK